MPSFSAEDVYELRDLSSLGGSPAHGMATFVVSQAIRDQDGYVSVIWGMGPGDEPHPLTSPESSASSPVISPDGRRLAFLSARGDGKQVHMLDLHGGEARRCGTLDDVPQSIEGWSPDGRRLLLTVSVPWAEDDLDDTQAEQRPVIVRFLPYKLDGTGFTAGHRTHLVALDIDEQRIVPLVDGDVDVGEAAYSPDGMTLAYTRARRGRQRHPDALCLCRADGSDERRLDIGLSSMMGIHWSPDGSTIAVSGSEREGEALHYLWLIDVAAGERRAATQGELQVLSTGITWSADGTRIAVIAEHEGRASVAVIDVARRQHTIFYKGLRQVASLAAHGDGLAYIASTMRCPPEVFTCDWQGENERQRGSFNGWFATRGRPRVSVRRMRVPHPNGGTERIDVWLLRPPRGEGPWPGLLYMHGGPESVVPIEHDRQLYWFELCEKGWVIVAPNAMGSSSYGADFARRLRGHWGECDLPQFLAVVDTLQEEGLVGDTVVCSGKSYGGFLSAWALGHTDRFAAGIVSAPVANVLSHQGTSDTGYYVTPYAVNAEATEDLEVYRRLSPLFMFETLKAPTLILQGEKDARCPLGQSEELFARALRQSDAEVTMVIYPGGWHSLSGSGRPSHRVDYNRRCARWIVEKTGHPTD